MRQDFQKHLMLIELKGLFVSKLFYLDGLTRFMILVSSYTP